MPRYLIKRGEIFYFRRALPFDVQSYFSRREIWKSLRTNNKKFAAAKATQYSAALDTLLIRIRSNTMLPIEFERFTSEFLDRLLDNDELRKRTLSTPKTLNDMQERLQNNINTHKSSKGRKDFLEFTLALGVPDHDSMRMADKAIETLSFDIDPNSQEYVNLCEAFTKMRITRYKTAAERSMGNYDNEYDLARRATTAIPPTTNSQQVFSDTPPKPMVTISEAGSRWIQEKENKKIGGATLASAKGSLKLLIAVLGDIPLHDITRDMMQNYLNTLIRLPRSKTKQLNDGTLSTSDAIKLVDDGLEPFTLANVDKHFTWVKSLLKWAASGGIRLTEYNVAEGLTLPKRIKGPSRDKRVHYTQNNLQGMITGLQGYRHSKDFSKHPERYWIPLLMLFCGLRREEAAQLLYSDFVVVDGINCMNIEWWDDEGKVVKQLKTESSKRTVPVHPTLIELGLLNYLTEKKKDGDERVWTALNPSKTAAKKGQLGRNIGDWWNGSTTQYKKDGSIKRAEKQGFAAQWMKSPRTDVKSLYSLRKSMTNALKQAMVPEAVADELTGHSSEGISYGTYAGEYNMATKLEALKKVDFGVDFVAGLGLKSKLYS